jgi:type IV pilus assembly protein PilN
MRISLNMATRPYADAGPTLKRLRIGMLVLAVISGGAVLGLHEMHNRAEAARTRAHSLDGAIARVSAERQGYVRMMQEPDNARLLAETKTLNALFDEKAFSWTLTMESLETVLPGGVQVSTLVPVREKDGHIVLRMRVNGPRDKGIEFVRNLEHSRRFLLPRIVDETVENANGPNQKQQPVSNTNPFSFDLLTDYNPPSPEELKAAGEPNQADAGSHQRGRAAQEHEAGRAGRAMEPGGAPVGRQFRPEYRRPKPLAKPNPDQNGNGAQGGPR